jgi:uncharacterized protein
MNPVLVDSWALIALMDPKDLGHLQAVDVSKKLVKESRIAVISEWILTEYLAYACELRWRAVAVQTVEQIRQSAEVQIAHANPADWQLGFDLFKARPDKEWSLVDCISICICGRLGITEVFTADHHFEQAGLRILVT